MIELLSMFIASIRVGQYIYLLLMVTHLVMAFERRYERKLIAQGYPFVSPLRELEFTNWLYASIFLTYVASLGEVAPKEVTVPIIRVLWAVILVQMLYLCWIKGRNILKAWKNKPK